MVDVEAVSDPGRFLERAAPLLAGDEARHNLAFGIVSTARDHPEVYPAFHGWLACRGGGPTIGAALRTPPLGLVLARPTDDDALGAIADSIEDALPGVVGAVPEVDEFGAHWTARHGVRATTLVDQRIYVLRQLLPPPGVAGSMRLATTDDRELVLGWMRAFAAEALQDGDDEGRLERSVDARLAGGADAGVALWAVDGEAVSLAGYGGPTPNGIRIGPVYTPPKRRRRGYGTAITAAVSELMLERGRRFCFLYTDLANPTSNAIYQRLGYEPVCDSREIAFVAG